MQQSFQAIAFVRQYIHSFPRLSITDYYLKSMETQVNTSSKGSKCRVCRKSFCEPKLLPCGHLMCRKCLLSWLEQTRRATCPYCRYPILKDDKDSQAAPVTSASKEDNPAEGDEGNAGIDAEKAQALVDAFPTELFMGAFVKAKQLLSQKKHKCTVCVESATSLCLHCGDTLCTNCKTVHSRLTATRHHVVEELSSLTAERLADVQTPTPCPQHPDEPCRLFCPQHNTSLCLLCASSRHRSCPQVKEFEEQVEEAKTKLNEIMKMITDGSTCIENALSKLDQHLADMEQRTETALTAVRTLKERLTKAVDDCTQRLEQKTNAAWEDIREAVKEAKSVLLGRQARLGSHTALTVKVHKSKARDVVCNMTSVMEARVKELERHVEVPEGAKAITTATLTVDESAVVRIEQELAKLGEVKVELSDIAANLHHRFHQSHGQYVTLSNNNKTATKTPGYLNYSTVVVSRPMAVGDLIEVQIDQWNTSYGISYTGYPFVGATTQSPDTINFQSQWSYQLSNTMVVTYNATFVSGASVSSPCSQSMRSVGQGTRLGVYLDNSRNLHLYINGSDYGVFASNVAQPCYALFDVCDYAQQVTLLERRKI